MTLETTMENSSQKLTFRVDGMDCASCANKIETALAKITGLSDVNVDFIQESLSLVNDSVKSQLDAKQIAQKIANLGFEVKLSNESIEHLSSCDREGDVCNVRQAYQRHNNFPGKDNNIALHITGMDCASCVSKIEVALENISGVSNVCVNFSTEEVRLTLAENNSSKVSDIITTINNLGFNVINHQSLSNSTPLSSITLRDNNWWQNKKAKRVIMLGALMITAYLISLLLPVEYANWVFPFAVLVGVIPLARQAYFLAKSGSVFSIETLVVVASLGALIIGEAPEAAAVVFLFSVGEFLESLAANSARFGIKSLASLVPKSAILIDSNGNQKNIDASSLAVNDIVLVRPGDKVPADGQIIQGQSSLDESPITGESIPSNKNMGDKVYAGSINIDGVIQIQVKKTAKDNTIARIIQLVEEAQSSKASTARFIEKFSRYYTPTVMLIALLIIISPPLLLGADWITWIYRGLALLLIACPCALVLSTPAAISSSLAVATRKGILIKGGNALEAIGQVATVAFDKTGTLTEGQPKLTELISLTDIKKDEILALAAAIESKSSHPLASAIIHAARLKNIDIPKAEDVTVHAGKSVQATINGSTYAIGSPTYASQICQLSSRHQQQLEELESDGNTVVILLNLDKQTTIGILALRDDPKVDAKQAISQLNDLKIHSIMLTGDNKRTAKAIANHLDIDWQAELLPQDKLDIINQIKLKKSVAMVGDGINDAPSLATADVGIAMGDGTDVALETADVALLKDRVTDVAYLVALSRATMHNIYQNITFALGLKGIFLITSILGITGLWIAVLADTGATALVTLNALRLLRFKTKKI